MKKIFIIILNWNGKKDTLECLDSLKKLKIAPQSGIPLRGKNLKLKIVTVDNGSNDGSVEAVHKEFPEVVILENKENLGFAEGNNVGIRYALENGTDYVILLNNDTLVEENLVAEMVKAAESDPEIALISPKIYFAKGYEFHKDRYQEKERGKVIWYAGGIIDWANLLASHRGVDEVDLRQYEKREETDFVTGCCMMVKKEVFSKIGFLDKKYFAYWEDTDFCQRAKLAGFKAVYVPEALLWHKNAASSGRPGSVIHQYYQTRNRLLFGFRYAALRTKLALFRESLKFLVGGGVRQKAVLDFYLRKLGRGKI